MENETVKTEQEPVVEQVVEQVQEAPEQVESSATEQAEQTGATEASEPKAEVKPEVKEEKKVEAKAEQQKDPRIEQAKRWQREKREFQEKIQELEQRVNRVIPNDSDDVKEIAAELGIPEDDAKKLNKILDKKLERLKPQQPSVDPKEVEKLERQFVNEVSDIRDEYHDWDEMQVDMQKAFVDYVQILNERGKDPLDAFRKGPEFFYLRAKSGKVQSASQALVQGKTEMAQKINQKNAASVESARSSSAKPIPKQGLTRADIEKMSPEEYSKRRDEIHRLAASGAIK